MLGRLGQRLGMAGRIIPKNEKVLDSSDISFFESCLSHLRGVSEKVRKKIQLMDSYTRNKKYALLRGISKFENYFRGVYSYTTSHKEVESGEEILGKVQDNIKTIHSILKNTSTIVNQLQKVDEKFTTRLEKDIKILEKMLVEIKNLDDTE